MRRLSKVVLVTRLFMRHTVRNHSLLLSCVDLARYLWQSIAGWTYCGIGTLSLLDKLPAQSRNGLDRSNSNIGVDMSKFIESLTFWLVSRQTSTVQALGNFAIPDEEASEMAPQAAPNLFNVQGAIGPTPESLRPHTPLLQNEDLSWAGFNGRCNKEPDTCYSFWTGGSLAVSSVTLNYLAF